MVKVVASNRPHRLSLRKEASRANTAGVVVLRFVSCHFPTVPTKQDLSGTPIICPDGLALVLFFAGMKNVLQRKTCHGGASTVRGHVDTTVVHTPTSR